MTDALQALLVSTGVVALAEIGDKTQLLALVLAAKYRKPVPIILGIFVATLLNHALAGLVGAWVAATVGPEWMRWILGVSFIAMAAWILVPDKVTTGRPLRARCTGYSSLLWSRFFCSRWGTRPRSRRSHWPPNTRVSGRWSPGPPSA